ncbi:hypothetical protein [Armatimonas sp.]|uniref:tetratricopeptide repeat protein n=1 Tax=Armatimonas sp. TaxID=1872638 RepID=UPI00286C17FC|nr:hypothetical protein [Armatimonas sp.]
MERIEIINRLCEDGNLSSNDFREFILLNDDDYKMKYLFSIFLKRKLIRSGDDSENFEMFKNAVVAYIYDKDENELDVEVTLAEIFRLMGDLKTALFIIDKNIKKNQKDPYLLYLKGYILMKMGMYNESVDFFKESLEIKEDQLCRDTLMHVLRMIYV